MKGKFFGKKKASPNRYSKLLLTFAFALILLLFTFKPLFAAANRSKPGDILFPLDQLIETVKIARAVDSQTKAKLDVQNANERQLEAQQLVAENSKASCQSSIFSQDGDTNLIENVNKALDLYAKNLSSAEVKSAQFVQDIPAFQNLMANIVEMNLHNLLVWESLGKLAPQELSGMLNNSVIFANESTDRALKFLSEERKEDIIARSERDMASITSTVNALISTCKNLNTDQATGTAVGGAKDSFSTSKESNTTESSSVRTIIDRIESSQTPKPTSSPTSNSNQYDLGVGSDDANFGIQLNTLLDSDASDNEDEDANAATDINTQQNNTGCNGVKLFGTCLEI